MLAAVLAAACGGSVEGDADGASQALALPGVVVSAPVKTSAATLRIGGVLHASVTYKNAGTKAVTFQRIVLTARPPGATHGGGPFDDFSPSESKLTLAAGKSVTLVASRQFSALDPTGTWELYATYEDATGSWHDATPSAHFTLTSSGPWTLTWHDEFDGTSTALDATKWSYEVGGNGWGNQELEYYRSGTANATVAEGALSIQVERNTGALSCWYGSCGYTSARITTQNKFTQTYGRFEARIQIPAGQGIWPAFWMLGSNIPSAGWPRCGEIDIMENIGRTPYAINGTLHGPDAGGNNASAGGVYDEPTWKPSAAYHLYAVEWEASAVRFYFDDVLYRTVTPALLPSSAWVFNHPFYLLLNVAEGGSWPGSPDATSVFPQTMKVDYVRAYKRG